jgi:lysophospholipase L1-like esterase/dienelactone hydrolase
MLQRICLGTFLGLFVLPVRAADPPQPPLPKVVLIGDSIRLGYAPLVARKLAGQAVVVSPAANGGDSNNVVKHLDEWMLREKPDVVHLNCGLHDLKQSKRDQRFQVDLAGYEANLQQIVKRIRQETSATLVFANTTPNLDERHARRKADFDRHEADVQRYNDKALTVMRGAGVPVNDLHGIVEQAGTEQMLGADGTHYTPAGYERLADAVADCVRRQLIIRRARPQPPTTPAPEAAARYRKFETEHDALVPRAYRELRVKDFPVPDSPNEWRVRRPKVLQTVVQSLGDLPPRPSPQLVRLVSREWRSGYTVERVAIDNGVDSEISALLLLPEKRSQPAAAILWLHSSTPDKTQILVPYTNGGDDPLGEVFVRAGYVVLSPDAYWHGDRVGTGPSGSAETGVKEQEALFKYHLWLGRTLWGMFVRDDQIALDYLCSRPEVDRTRIGATGMSMGSTRAWWLAAVDERVAATVGVACLTRYQNLIAHGQLRQHGVYYWVDGLLKHFDMEGVIALIAPRPYLALTGELDAGSPADGIKVIEAKAKGVYRALGAEDHFKSILYPGIGHTYTPAMRAEMLRWFARWLKPDTAK